MMDVLSVVGKIFAAILVFGLIIFVHELGHFLAAKATGIKVNEFALGMGPRLLKWGKKETVYSVRAFPIGGFCAMEGEDEQSDNPRAFGNKPVWRRIVVTVAGVVMNFILGFVLLVVALGVCVQPPAGQDTVLFNSTVIGQFADDAVCNGEGGLRVGDEILSINGSRVVTFLDWQMSMQTDEDGIMDITVRRDGEKVELKDVPFQLTVDEATGQRTLQYGFVTQGIEKTAGSVIVMAGKLEYSYTTLIWRSLGDLVTGKYGLNDLSGPVGTMDVIGDAVEDAVQVRSLDSLYFLLTLVVLITVNVGVFNLLPLPALDGGRLVFLLIELIFRKPVPAKYEGIVHFVGFILLILLMIVVTFSDVWKIFA